MTLRHSQIAKLPQRAVPPTKDLRAVVKRLSEILDCKNEAELADKIGVSRTTINTWKHRNKLNDNIFNLCLKIAAENNVDAGWLFFGDQEVVPDHVVNQRKEILDELDVICEWIKKHNKLKPSSLLPNQLKAAEKFAYIYKLDESGVIQLMNLLGYMGVADG